LWGGRGGGSGPPYSGPQGSTAGSWLPRPNGVARSPPEHSVDEEDCRDGAKDSADRRGFLRTRSSSRRRSSSTAARTSSLLARRRAGSTSPAASTRPPPRCWLRPPVRHRGLRPCWHRRDPAAAHWKAHSPAHRSASKRHVRSRSFLLGCGWRELLAAPRDIGVVGANVRVGGGACAPRPVRPSPARNAEAGQPWVPPRQDLRRCCGDRAGRRGVAAAQLVQDLPPGPGRRSGRRWRSRRTPGSSRLRCERRPAGGLLVGGGGRAWPSRWPMRRGSQNPATGVVVRRWFRTRFWTPAGRSAVGERRPSQERTYVRQLAWTPGIRRLEYGLDHRRGRPQPPSPSTGVLPFASASCAARESASWQSRTELRAWGGAR
jgi:hypothetical protein